ncbi:alanine racemase [Lentilactobacillus kefiri]|uniref:Alanine racemase n=2 Tax=Lentilactobacillus kefiri TaxID=33962 RepID=A0A8E1V195_LENKE|nr:alanine racemase [Lentilactobacillus kefiri]KRL53549.1 alanine racemase [Lentilactobacillus parakefiri DSM 10551]KRM50536.1 alanine racemase [Lentilactobacillus kefiri DSM 20587 = JCM 5818]MCJ2161517.1 alanine racemase [Lentilactobacillus kefiri]MCP9368978.1 alanine racemase [Lentilactobacillus kefiri]MDH5108273.1 alanine racemase [Lentilactobacillus kefiri]
MMAVGNLRNAQLIINLKAIYSNIKHAKERLDPDTALFQVIKADGYGHGAIAVAKVAERAGASGFCVAILDEALELRQAGITKPILVLGITDPELAQVAANQNISLTVGSSAWLNRAGQLLQNSQLDGKLNVHLALDTGMGRIGFQTADELEEALGVLKQHPSTMNFEGIFTHFATADSPDDSYFKFQYQNFQDFMAVVKNKPKYIHVANSATSLWHKVCGGNMIRLGISAYGLNPSGGEIAKLPYELQPALSFTTEIDFVKYVKKGRSIGYGATYTADSDQWIGTVPVGYADGVPRAMQGFSVLVDGHKCPIVGRVCMDQFMIRLPKNYSYGTKVTIIGKSGDLEITADDVADYLKTISYEVICGFSSRIRRKYL